MMLCKNIFLVEEDANDKTLLVEAIKVINNNIKYTVAFNSKDALRKLEILKHKPDLIFLDISFPEIDGFMLLKQVKAKKGLTEIPVIVLSTSGNIKEKVYGLGASGFILKPVSVSKLQEEIEYVLVDKEMKVVL